MPDPAPRTAFRARVRAALGGAATVSALPALLAIAAWLPPGRAAAQAVPEPPVITTISTTTVTPPDAAAAESPGAAPTTAAAEPAPEPLSSTTITTGVASTSTSATTSTSTTTTSTSTTTTTTMTTTTTTRPPRIPLVPSAAKDAALRTQRDAVLAAQDRRAAELGRRIAAATRDRNRTQRAAVGSLRRLTAKKRSAAATARERERLDVLRRVAAVHDQERLELGRALALVHAQSRLVRDGRLEKLRGFVNPVMAPSSPADNFGAARVGHRHEGIDIFATRGTPVVATVDGVLRDVKDTPIGGRIVYVTSSDGTYYYYAHLDAWAPGIVDGVHVVAGQILGFLGRTGNAEATPPHLHFEIHPLGGPAINPFPVIWSTARGNRSVFDAWTVPLDALCREVADDAKREAAATSTTLAPRRTTTTRQRRTTTPRRTTTTAVPASTTTKPPRPTYGKPVLVVVTPTTTTIAPGACAPIADASSKKGRT